MAYTYNPLTNELDYTGAGGGGGGGGSSGITWLAVSGTSQSAQANHGYICQNSSLTLVTLPLTAIMGTTIEIVAQGTGGFQILQNAGQSVSFSSEATTVGVAGSISSSFINDTLRLLCVTDNLTWIVVSSMGNFILT